MWALPGLRGEAEQLVGDALAGGVEESKHAAWVLTRTKPFVNSEPHEQHADKSTFGDAANAALAPLAGLHAHGRRGDAEQLGDALASEAEAVAVLEEHVRTLSACQRSDGDGGQPSARQKYSRTHHERR